MKRELKVRKGDVQRVAIIHCKAHPDEKGTERNTIRISIAKYGGNCKAHPDEKGTESLNRPWPSRNLIRLQGPSR